MFVLIIKCRIKNCPCATNLRTTYLKRESDNNYHNNFDIFSRYTYNKYNSVTFNSNSYVNEYLNLTKIQIRDPDIYLELKKI